MGTDPQRLPLGTRGVLVKKLKQHNGGEEEEVVPPTGPAGATMEQSTNPNRKYRSVTHKCAREDSSLNEHKLLVLN